MTRSRRRRGGEGREREGRNNKNWEKQLTGGEGIRCNTKKELKGRKDKRRCSHADKKQRRDKEELTPSVTGNPGERQGFVPA